MNVTADLASGPAADWQPPAATGTLNAVIRLPGSKSITNRALVLAALGDGPTTITGPLRARDTLLMAAALRALGATVDTGNAVPQPGPGTGASAGDGGREVWRVTPGQRSGAAAVDVGNAGTVLRFVPPVAALTRADAEFSGDPRISQRPVTPLLAALTGFGAVIADGGRGAAPFTVHGRGELAGGTVTLDASASSQLVSGLLLAAPRFGKGAEIRHEGPPVPSAPHLAMTVAMLRAAGAQVTADDRRRDGSAPGAAVVNRWRVLPGALRPRRLDIEPDLSSAAPFLAAALVAGGTVTIADWPACSLQAASQILAVLTAMGGQCSARPSAAGAGTAGGNGNGSGSETAVGSGMTVTGSGRIRGVTADLRDVAELTPVLTALAALADSPSRFTGIGHLRAHETDRLAALAAEISALGGEVTELADGLAVTPRPLRAGVAPFRTYDDHRLVMAAAVLALAVPGLRIAGAATVAKTFPGFTSQWAALLAGSP